MAIREFNYTALYDELYIFTPGTINPPGTINGSGGGLSVNRTILAGGDNGFTSTPAGRGANTDPSNFDNGGNWTTGSFSIDFQQFPSLPEDSTITRVRMRCDLSYGCTAVVSSSGGTMGEVGTVAAAVYLAFTNLLFESHDYNHSDPYLSIPFNGGANSGVGGPGEFDWEILYPGGISYIDFVAIWQSMLMTFMATGVWNFGSGDSEITGSAFSASATMSNWRFEVEYDAAPFVYPFEVDTPGPVKVADPIQISSSVEAGGLNGVESIILTLEDGTEIIVDNFNIQTPTLLEFDLPPIPGGYTGEITITLIGSGKTFSGSIALGTLEVLFVNGSGLYTLVKDKRTDSVYDRDAEGEVLELKIFNPFGKTGYIGD